MLRFGSRGLSFMLAMTDRHRRRLILFIAGVLLPLAVIGERLAIHFTSNDVREWLPKGYAETNQYRWFREHFGSEEFVLVTWPGCVLDEPRLEQLAASLDPSDKPAANAHRFFQSVTTGPRRLEELTGPPLNLRYATAVSRLQGLLIGPDRQQTCALLTLTDVGKAHLHEMIAAIHDAAAECGVERQSLRLGGPPIVTAAVDVEGRRSTTRLAILSALVGTCISWFMLRSGRLTAMVIVIGLYAAAASLAIIWCTGTAMNAILQMTGPLVYVSATSGAIHLVNYYRDSVVEKGPRGAVSRAVAHALLPLSLATGTTAAGLLSLCYSDLLPIQHFGLYSAVGVVLSFLLLVLVLPAALDTWPTDVPVGPVGNVSVPMARWRAGGQFICRNPHWFSLACLLLMTLAGLGLGRIQTSVKVIKFFSPKAEILHDYAWLEQHLGALVPVEVVLRVHEDCELDILGRLALVDRIQRSIASLPDVGSSLSAVTFVPPLGKSDGRWSLRRSVLETRIERSRDRLVKLGYLTSADHEELWRITLRVKELTDVDYGYFTHSIRERVEPVLAAEGASVKNNVSVVYTGIVPLVYKAQRSLLDGMVFGLVTDVALIFVVTILLMRHWSIGLVLLLTSVFPAITVLGSMGWLGIVVDIGSVMTPCIALGVTVDDVLHFLLWFRRGIVQGLNRGEAVMLAYDGCGRAMYQSWGVIGLGLSVFAFSPFVPTSRFGLLMVILLTIALFGNLVLLPALLAGPLGAIYGRRILKKQQEMAEPGETSAAQSVARRSAS